MTDSQFIADEIARHSLPANKQVVAPLGHAPRFHCRSADQLAATLNTFGLRERGYLICVGTLEPHKNLQWLSDYT